MEIGNTRYERKAKAKEKDREKMNGFQRLIYSLSGWE